MSNNITVTEARLGHFGSTRTLSSEDCSNRRSGRNPSPAIKAVHREASSPTAGIDGYAGRGQAELGRNQLQPGGGSQLRTRTHPFTQSEVELGAMLAKQMGLAVQASDLAAQAKLYRTALPETELRIPKK